MAWKQDLAKLKQQLGPEVAQPVPKRPAKAVPRVADGRTLDDEDAIFLAAMGLRAVPPRKDPAPTNAEPEPSAVPVPPEGPTSFPEALKDLKGLKPLAKGPLPQPTVAPLRRSVGPKPPAPAQVPGPAPASAAATQAPAAPQAAPPVPGPVPQRFQLAAGMAIEVDGVLDLRGHSLRDATERLKDRLEDGLVLGWRSLLVNLGPDPALHDGLLALLASGEAAMVARFAQAPVPMGGNQAWLLYFNPASDKS